MGEMKRRTSLLAMLVVLLGGALGVTIPAQAQTQTIGAPSVASGVMPSLDFSKAQSQTSAGKVKGLPGRVQALSAKAPNACSPVCYDYAGAKQNVNFDGWVDKFSIQSAAVAAGDFHSLTEGTAQDFNGNTVEIGITHDTSGVCAAEVSVCLFIFNWVSGTPGCYNGCGVFPTTGCSPCPGGSLVGDIGTTKEFSVQYLPSATPAGWYFAYNGSWIAGIPETDWTNPPVGGGTATTFTRGAFVQMFGEVAASTPGSCTDMGNSTLATGSPSFLGAKMDQFTLVNGSATANLNAVIATAPTKWSSVAVNPATNLSYRYGGPGWC